MAEERSAKGRVEVVEPGQAELANARRVAEAKATVPHAHVEAEVELAAAPAQEEVIAALAGALREHPKLNAAYRDGRFELYERINVAVAVETDAGLAYPTIFDADAKDTAAIAGELSELGKHAREGTITQPQLAGATLSFADLRAARRGTIGARASRRPGRVPDAWLLARRTRAVTGGRRPDRPSARGSGVPWLGPRPTRRKLSRSFRVDSHVSGCEMVGSIRRATGPTS